MALAAGSRLGPYEVVSPLGVGAMGEVYRARDPRLGREVAVKVISSDEAGQADRQRRFEQEARAVAALSHPNILAVYDVGSQGGTSYVVFELLDGRTLQRRLEHGPVPVRKATEYGVQICRGLAAAHARGIVHRDLKPQNLFLTADGQVKILDFGLAKLQEPSSPGSAAERGETPTATEAGLVLGTAGYMSPEQARGRAADARSDIFALGAILYEMLSGRRAFEGESAADMISAILNRDPPDIGAASAEPVPPGLERVIRRCLEKDPDERFQTARDVAFALEALSGQGGGDVKAPVAPPGDARRHFARIPERWTAGLVRVQGRRLRRRGRRAGGRARPGSGRPQHPSPRAEGHGLCPDHMGSRGEVRSLVRGRPRDRRLPGVLQRFREIVLQPDRTRGRVRR